MATSLPCFFRAYVVDRSAYFCFLVFMSLTEAIIFSFWCLCRWQKRLFSLFGAYVVDRSDYFLFLVLMSLSGAIIFAFWCLCRCQKRLFLLFGAYVVVRSAYFCFLVLHTLYVAFNFLHLVFLRWGLACKMMLTFIESSATNHTVYRLIDKHL